MATMLNMHYRSPCHPTPLLAAEIVHDVCQLVYPMALGKLLYCGSKQRLSVQLSQAILTQLLAKSPVGHVDKIRP